MDSFVEMSNELDSAAKEAGITPERYKSPLKTTPSTTIGPERPPVVAKVPYTLKKSASPETNTSSTSNTSTKLTTSTTSKATPAITPTSNKSISKGNNTKTKQQVTPTPTSTNMQNSEREMIIPQASQLKSSSRPTSGTSKNKDPITIESIRKQDAETQIAMLREIVETKLRVELREAVEARDTLSTEIDSYNDLLTNLQVIKRSKQVSLESKVDLGSGFFVQAKVPDCSTVFVEIGLGFNLEFTLDEAIEFIPKKISQITLKQKRLDEAAASLSARIKVIYHGIGELMNFGAPSQKQQPQRTIY